MSHLEDVVLSLDDFLADLPSAQDILCVAEQKASKEEPWFDLYAKLRQIPSEVVDTELAILELEGIEITAQNVSDWPKILLSRL